jgi:hypothetical protein
VFPSLPYRGVRSLPYIAGAFSMTGAKLSLLAGVAVVLLRLRMKRKTAMATRAMAATAPITMPAMAPVERPSLDSTGMSCAEDVPVPVIVSDEDVGEDCEMLEDWVALVVLLVDVSELLASTPKVLVEKGVGWTLCDVAVTSSVSATPMAEA